MGLHSVLSIHLFTDHRVLGRLNLYYASVADFSDDEVEAARVVAAHASVALARLRSERDLWRAIDSRHLIGQAQGILDGTLPAQPGEGVLGAPPPFPAGQHQAARGGGRTGRTGRLPPADRPDRPADRQTGGPADRRLTATPGTIARVISIST